jgi:hypothetical protein
LELNDEGEWRPTKIAPLYRRLFELAELYQRATVQAIQEANTDDGKPVTFLFPDIDALAIAGLQANYRIGPTELAFFDAYDVPTRQRMISAIMDDETFMAWQKKRTESVSDGSDTSLGLEPSTQASA